MGVVLENFLLERRRRVQAVVEDFRNSPGSCVQVTMNTGVSR